MALCRLDFETFTIADPSASTELVGKQQNTDTTTASQCLDDTFSVISPGGITPPVLCGDVTNEHSEFVQFGGAIKTF